MTSYSLVALFLLTGDTYIERDGLTLHGCAGQAALARQELMASLPVLNGRIGEVRYLCVPEHSLARTSTDQHGLGEDRK